MHFREESGTLKAFWGKINLSGCLGLRCHRKSDYVSQGNAVTNVYK
jgi:hypothetical protein